MGAAHSLIVGLENAAFRDHDRLDAELARPFTSNLDRFMLAAYNIGAGAFCGSSMSRRAQAGDLAGASDALLMWNKARVDGVLQVVRGLDRRRAAERTLCLQGLTG